MLEVNKMTEIITVDFLWSSFYMKDYLRKFRKSAVILLVRFSEFQIPIECWFRNPQMLTDFSDTEFSFIV